MGLLWDFVLIVSLLTWLLGLAVRGDLSAEQVALALVGLVFLRALGRGIGGSVGRTVRTVFAVALPVAVLLTLAVYAGAGDTRATAAILGQVGVLLVVLLGLHIMFRGLFPR